MPKITAPTLVEHVTLRHERILAVATDLFTQRGFTGVDLADIAAHAGLARNSLYKYFKDKEDLFMACVFRASDPIFAGALETIEQQNDPLERILTWAEVRADFFCDPRHRIIQMLYEAPVSAIDMRRELESRNKRLRALLDDALETLLAGSGRNPQLVGHMIASMIAGVVRHAQDKGKTDQIVTEVRASVRAILQPGAIVHRAAVEIVEHAA
ncbi:MAG: TetR/AcrR family transcriptional regulator [Rhodospirillaceae bacterium]|nr:TetR/AcrR family transcriptional regulator [Rhodospirillaceae bacterium]